MTRRFVSTVAGPRDRGLELGEVHREQVGANVAVYDEVFARRGEEAGLTSIDVAGLVEASGHDALGQIDAWAPELSAEIRGIADGAGLRVARIAALNARTEVLARLGRAARGECSTVVFLGGEHAEPLAMQNWDWFGSLADGWFEWEIPHADGRTTTTLTEYGIVGKIGINGGGVGTLFNILHHRLDGASQTVGIPVHVAARRVLDTAESIDAAIALLASASRSASTAITVVGGRAAGNAAVTAELWPGGLEALTPDAGGLLLHTNHFLADAPAAGDLEPEQAPDSLTRLAALRRQLAPALARTGSLTERDAFAALCDHGDGPLSVCSHPDPNAPEDDQCATLAAVRLDFEHGGLEIHPGNPCTRGADAVGPTAWTATGS